MVNVQVDATPVNTKNWYYTEPQSSHSFVEISEFQTKNDINIPGVLSIKLASTDYQYNASGTSYKKTYQVILNKHTKANIFSQLSNEKKLPYYGHIDPVLKIPCTDVSATKQSENFKDPKGIEDGAFCIWNFVASYAGFANDSGVPYDTGIADSIHVSTIEYTETTNRCYKEKEERKYSESSDDRIEKPKKKVLYNAAGDSIYRENTLRNLRLDFTYSVSSFSTRSAQDNSDGGMGDTVKNYIGTCNKSAINLCGFNLDKYEAKILSMEVEPLRYLDRTYYRITVSVEIQVEKPVYNTRVIGTGYNAKIYMDGSWKKFRVQSTLTPTDYVTENSASAFHVWRGYGFYGDDMPQLNIQEPIALNKNGEILQQENPDITDDNLNIVNIYEAPLADWSKMAFPKTQRIRI